MLRGPSFRASRSRVTAWRVSAHPAVTQTTFPTIRTNRSVPTMARRLLLRGFLSDRRLDVNAAAKRPAASHIVGRQRVVFLRRYETSWNCADCCCRDFRFGFRRMGSERSGTPDEFWQPAHSGASSARPADTHAAIPLRQSALAHAFDQRQCGQRALRLSLLWRHRPRQRRLPLDGTASDRHQERQLVEPLSRLQGDKVQVNIWPRHPCHCRGAAHYMFTKRAGGAAALERVL